MAQSAAQDFSSVVEGLKGIFGSSGSQSTSGTTINKGTTTQRLNISQEAVEKIIADVLGGADGLAAIFAGQNASGIFDSSVAAQAAGDLTSKLVGEIAKLTAEQETEIDTTQTVSNKAKSKDGGLLGGLKSLF